MLAEDLVDRPGYGGHFGDRAAIEHEWTTLLA